MCPRVGTFEPFIDSRFLIVSVEMSLPCWTVKELTHSRGGRKRRVPQTVRAVSRGSEASPIVERITLSRNQLWLVQMNLTMIFPIFRAGSPFTAEEAQLREAMKGTKVLLVTAVYVLPSPGA